MEILRGLDPGSVAALIWLGSEVLPTFRSLPDPAGQPDALAVASR
jgi:hypothetical protein